MEDFFGIDINNFTFDHQQNNFVSDVHELFDEETDESFTSDSYHINNIRFFNVGSDRVLLVLIHPARLYFRGALSVSCLGGSVELDGYIMKSDESSSALDIYSPCSHSALCFATLDAEVHVSNKLEATLKSLQAQYLLQFLVDQPPISCLLLISRNELHGFNDLSSELKQALLPDRAFYSGINYFPEAEECLNCVFDVESGDRIKQKIKYNELLRNAAKELLCHKAPRLAVCGERRTGKSTALRFLVNQLLSLHQSVLIIDFDVGQPEFTVPGCVSLILVSIPLLGPSYTHITTPLRSIFLGFVNADMCIDDYREAIKEFENFCHETSDFSSIPWLINTMGYVKGCGLLLLNDIISRFKLTHCLQLNNTDGPSNKKCFPLVPQITDDNCGSKSFLKYFQIFHSSKTGSNITPRVFRELMVTFYFTCHKFFLNLQEIKMNYNEHSANENTVLFDSLLTNNNSLMRGEVVAVCVPILENCYYMVPYLKRCVGFGLVVSCYDNKLTILTPVHPSIFGELCYIVRGDLQLRNGFADDILSKTKSHSIYQTSAFAEDLVEPGCTGDDRLILDAQMNNLFVSGQSVKE